jgi:hypothetical protein
LFFSSAFKVLLPFVDAAGLQLALSADDNETPNEHQTPNTKHQLSTATSNEVKSVFTAVTRNLFGNIEKKLREIEDIEETGRELVDRLKITEREVQYVVQE